MYKKTSQFIQAGADKSHFLPIKGGEENLTDEERLDILRKQSTAMQLKIIELPKNSKERKQLSLNFFKLNTEINNLRGGKKNRTGIAQIFLDVANRVLTKEQYDNIMTEAQHIYDVRAAVPRMRATEKRLKEFEIAIKKQSPEAEIQE